MFLVSSIIHSCPHISRQSNLRYCIPMPHVDSTDNPTGISYAHHASTQRDTELSSCNTATVSKCIQRPRTVDPHCYPICAVRDGNCLLQNNRTGCRCLGLTQQMLRGVQLVGEVSRSSTQHQPTAECWNVAEWPATCWQQYFSEPLVTNQPTALHKVPMSTAWALGAQLVLPGSVKDVTGQTQQFPARTQRRRRVLVGSTGSALKQQWRSPSAHCCRPVTVCSIGYA